MIGKVAVHSDARQDFARRICRDFAPLRFCSLPMI
jgi:hypothetical protein